MSLAESVDDRPAGFEHLDQPEEGQEVRVPLPDLLTRAGLSWLLRGKVYASGSAPADLLLSPQPGDFAVLQPPPSKSDPFDMVWGSKPIFLPFCGDPLSAFTSLADIERVVGDVPGVFYRC